MSFVCSSSCVLLLVLCFVLLLLFHQFSFDFLTCSFTHPLSHRMNLGRGRSVPTPILPEKFYVHRTVDILTYESDGVCAGSEGEC